MSGESVSGESVSGVTGFSLKRGTEPPCRGVKPANKVGAINYKEPVTYKHTVP